MLLKILTSLASLLKGRGNNATLYEYVLTLDIAKEICMCVGVAPRTNEETRKLSKEYRKYFIECEKKLKEIDPRANLLLAIYNGGEEGVLASKQLTELEVQKATKPLIEEIEHRLIDINVKINLSDSAINYFIDNGYDEFYGARPLKRLVNNKLETIIARKLINNEIKSNTTINVDYANEELKID